MGFNIGAFARGFAERATEQKREKEDEIKELVKASYIDSLNEAKELRKERKAKRQKLKELGAQLKQFGFSDAQSAGLLSMGEEGAKNLLSLAQTAKVNNKDFDVSAFYTVAEESDLTLEDAINRTMGELKKPAEEQLPGFASQKTFLGGDMSDYTREQFGQYEQAFGESYQQIRAEAEGEYKYGALPTGTIDFSMLKDADKTQIDQLKLEEAKLKVQIAKKELQDADDNDLSISQQSSAGNYIRDSIAAQIAQHVGEGIVYNPNTRSYVGPEGALEKQREAERLLNTATAKGIDFINASPSKANALNASILNLQDVVLPGLFNQEQEVPLVTPDAVDKAEGSTASAQPTETVEPATEEEIEAFLEQQFADPSYANIASPNAKRNKKAQIRAQARQRLMATGQYTPQEINDILLRLTKDK